MPLDYQLMGKRLKKARIKKHYTQEELAELMNVSVAYISRIETGKTHLNLTRLNEVCTILDTTEAHILNGASDDSSVYLNEELSTLLKDCSSEEKELIYQIANIIKSKENEES